jgi:group I intron endonuclease
MNVYCLYFPNGKRYFGVEKTKGVRLAKHKSDSKLVAGKKYPQLVSKALAKYGWVNIQVRYVAENISKEAGLALEALLIASHRTQDKRLGYNVDPGGGRYCCGRVPSDETRKKRSESLKALGRKMPEEHKAVLSEINRTRVRTREERDKIAKSLRGRKRSEEAIRKHREKMTGCTFSPEALENMKAAGAKRRGHRPSEETRRKMSESAKKRKASEETRRKISEGNKGKTISAEQRAKISKAHMGKKKSPEHLAKIGQALKGRKVHNAGKTRITLPDGTQAYVDKKDA